MKINYKKLIITSASNLHVKCYTTVLNYISLYLKEANKSATSTCSKDIGVLVASLFPKGHPVSFF